MNINLAGCGPIGRDIIERDRHATSTSYAREYALVIDHAQGAEVWDVDGRRFVDLMAGVAVMNVGHRHPYVVEKVKETLDKFWHVCLTDFYYPQAMELAERLQTIAPMRGKTRSYFGNSGTEAVEAAIKLAMAHTRRPYFIGFRGAFHGRTLGALSFTSSKYLQRSHYRVGVPVTHIPYPNPYRPTLHREAGQDAADAVLNFLENEIFRTTLDPTDVAGILLEPIQGEGGYVLPPDGFLTRLRALCDKYGIMLMVDEVQSGAGRTGDMWAVEHEGVEPDILCFAKGIASGMPLGGIIAKDDVMTWKPGTHASTYGGGPVACAAALATLDVIEEEDLLARADETGAYILDRLTAMQQRYYTMGDVRGRGLMIGVEFVKDRETKERYPEMRHTVIQKAFEKGVLMLPCGANTIRLTPALNIGRDLVDEGLDLFESALIEAERLHPYQGHVHIVPALA
ncbi:MAG: acetyl ornithine aminotransferase family protein [Anaerolineae bacterium]|nr:acetyl ornithine aminotransferase family protein [Anaerolineae bacterium]